MLFQDQKMLFPLYLVVLSGLCKTVKNNDSIATNVRKPVRRKLTTNDVFYTICYKGVDNFPLELITTESYKEYLKCHPSKLFDLPPHIRTREFINNAINKNPRIFTYIPYMLRTIEQEQIYNEAIKIQSYFDFVIIAAVVSAAMIYILK